jgi:hypothetical protein
MQFPVVVVAGASSNVGKTTLVCSLLEHFPGWEAIKVTRGHYRSCGRDPDTCCVSHLLGDAPKVLSDRILTDVPTKDTGRFWAAGASNVHWLIATTSQVERGIVLALERVKGPGVLVEGTSILEFLRPSVSILTLSGPGNRLKSTALRALRERQIDVVFNSSEGSTLDGLVDANLPVFYPSRLNDLADLIRKKVPWERWPPAGA